MRYLGPLGAVSVGVACYYWRMRSLWPAVFAHTLANVVALV